MKTYKNAYSFVRWSTKSQGKNDKDSLSRQIKSAKNWSEANGFKLSDEMFIGAGESAYRGKHLKSKDGIAIGALAKFIDAVEKGLIVSDSALCIDSVDRFSRQEILKALEPFTRLLNLGIGIVFTGSYTPKLLTSDLINKEPHWLQVVINDMIRSWTESDEKSRKVKSGMQKALAKLQNGEKTKYHRAPKYFDFVNGKYVLNKHAITVQRMAQMIIDGNSLYKIATIFNAEKVPTLQRDTQWSTTTIRRVLKSRTMVGEQFGRKEFYPNVLDVDMFNRVQNVLNQNTSFNLGKGAKFVNMYRGIVYCKCGHTLNSICQTKDRKGNLISDPFKYRYFRCVTKSLGKRCPYEGSVKVLSFEQQFFGDFLLQNPKAMVADKSETKTIQSKINVAKSEIAKTNAEISKILAMSSKFKLEQLDSLLSKLNSELDAKKLELDSLNSSLGKIQLAPDHFDNIKKLLADFEGELAEHALEDWVLGDKAMAYDDAIKRITEVLKDNDMRAKIKTILPTLVGKVVIDVETNTFEVFNHSGKVIYKSVQV